MIYIRSDISYIRKQYFPEESENIFFEILLPKTKGILVGIIYRSPNQNSFLELLSKNFPSIDKDKKETYILGNFDINIYENNKYKVHENDILCTKFASATAKEYHPFCRMQGLKQLTQCPTRQTCSTAALIDHLLTGFLSRVSQKGVTNIGFSDYQLPFCKRKNSKLKICFFQKYIKFRSLQNYRTGDYKKSLRQLVFPNYENVDDVSTTYSDFFQKIMIVIDKIAPYKTKKVKRNTQKRIDGEGLEKLNSRDKLFQKFKTSRLHTDKELLN